MTLPLLILQPGQKLPELSGYPGDFADWVLAGMEVDRAEAMIIRPQAGDALPDPATVRGIVITGSGAMVTEQADWMRQTEAWLRRVVAQATPLLGICFGHQLLAHALGGEVADNPRGIEVGTVATRLTREAASDPLFAGLGADCRVQTSHQQSVRRLPAGAVLLSASEQDPHHAFRYGAAAWGVQFHPEFSATVVAAYEAFYASRLSDAYRQGQAGRRQADPCGSEILRRFAQICRS